MKRTHFTPDMIDRESYEGLTSLTVPGEAYSIRELLQKYTQGIMPAVAREGYYEDTDDEDFDVLPDRLPDFDLTHLDIAKTIIEEAQTKKTSEKGKKRAKNDQTNSEQGNPSSDGENPEIGPQNASEEA